MVTMGVLKLVLYVKIMNFRTLNFVINRIKGLFQRIKIIQLFGELITYIEGDVIYCIRRKRFGLFHFSASQPFAHFAFLNDFQIN